MTKDSKGHLNEALRYERLHSVGRFPNKLGKVESWMSKTVSANLCGNLVTKWNSFYETKNNCFLKKRESSNQKRHMDGEKSLNKLVMVWLIFTFFSYNA